MDDYRPQDEYFEWDDVIAYKRSSGDENTFQHPPLRYSSSVSRTFTFDIAGDLEDDFAWSDESSLCTTPSSLSSTDSLCSLKDIKTDADLDFPSYDDSSCSSCVTIDLATAMSLTAPPSPILTPVSNSMRSKDFQFSESVSRMISRGDTGIVARDDSALTIQPFQNVNYLTHNWCEEDISNTWRYVISRKSDLEETASRRTSIGKPLNNVPRYENALWRSWAQRRFQLKTVSPETINWMKSCDETTLYGPFMMKTDAFSSSTKVTAACARSENLLSKSVKPLLKHPKISEILLRGSIPTFVSTRRVNDELHQSTFQARPSYDPSVSCLGMSDAQRREVTSVALSKLGLRRSAKSVRFSNQVEQCEIIKVRVNSKNMRRTLRKLPFTTLDKVSILPTPTIGLKTGNHFSPESLCSYNPDNSPEKEKSWSGITGDDEIATLRPALIRIHKPSSGSSSPDTTPHRSKHHRSSSISTVNTALELHLQNLKYEDHVDDELDYLLYNAASLPASPPSLDSSSGSGSDDNPLESVSDEDDFPFFGSGDISDEKVGIKAKATIGTIGVRRGVEKSGRWSRDLVAKVRIVGEDIEDEAARQLLRSEMEEFDLVLG